LRSDLATSVQVLAHQQMPQGIVACDFTKSPDEGGREAQPLLARAGPIIEHVFRNAGLGQRVKIQDDLLATFDLGAPFENSGHQLSDVRLG
jgi:hypothetical protein